MHGELTSEVLPWLVRHGEVLGYVVSSLMVLAGGLAGLWALRSRDGRRAARRRRVLGTPRGDFEDGPGVFSGVLEADGTIERFDDGAGCAVAVARMGDELATRHAEGLRLRVKETTIALDGPLDVLVGSEERRFSRADALTPEVTARVVAESGAEWKVRSLQPGDRVLARGILAREADGGAERDYRSASERLVLQPGPDGVIQLATCEIPRVSWRMLRALVAVVPGGLLGFALTWAAGAWAFQSIPSDGEAPRSIGLSAQLATVSPMHRDRAVARLKYLYVHGDGPWDLRRAETALALGGLDSCRQPLFDGIAQLEDDDFVDIALRCRQRQLAARRFIARGDFERASELLASDQIVWREWERAAKRSSGFVHLLAGEPERAAAVARSQADMEQDRLIIPGRPLALRCLAIAIETGAAEGRAPLADAKSAAAHPIAANACGLLHALTNDDPEAGAAELRSVSESYRFGWLASLLLAARGEWPRSFRPARTLADRAFFSTHDIPVALGTLEHAIAHPPPLEVQIEPPPATDSTVLWIADHAEPALAPALFYVVAGSALANIQSRLGDRQAAHTLLRQIAPYVDLLERYRDALETPFYTATAALGALTFARMSWVFVALRKGDHAAVEGILEDAGTLTERSREVADLARIAAAPTPAAERLTPWIRSRTSEPELRDALVEAALGDLSRVTALRERDDYRWRVAVERTGPGSQLSLLAIAIRGAESGREELRTSLEDADPVSGFVEDDLRTLDLHRQVARAAAATELEARIERAQAEYRERLRDPFTSLMWTIWASI